MRPCGSITIWLLYSFSFNSLEYVLSSLPEIFSKDSHLTPQKLLSSYLLALTRTLERGTYKIPNRKMGKSTLPWPNNNTLTGAYKLADFGDPGSGTMKYSNSVHFCGKWFSYQYSCIKTE